MGKCEFEHFENPLVVIFVGVISVGKYTLELTSTKLNNIRIMNKLKKVH